MSVSLSTWHGKPALEIADATGEIFRYLWCVIPGTVWGVELAKIDPETDQPRPPYVVRQAVPWFCNCADYSYRRKRTTGEPCKHVSAVKELRELLAVLQGVTP